MRPVAVFTHSGDLHASHFADKSIERGLPFRLIFTDKVAESGGLHLNCATNEISFTDIDGEDFKLHQASAVWWRRISGVQQGIFVRDEFRSYVEESWRDLFGADLSIFCPDTKFVNNPVASRLGYNKVGQLKLAQHLGFGVPKTIISSDFQKILEFCSETDVVVKPLTSSSEIPVYVHKLDPQKLGEHAAGLAPCIYQECLDSEVNYRVNVFGERVFAFRVINRDLDWRIGKSRFEKVELCNDLEDKCINFIKRSNLAVGMIDLKENDVGDIFFLENNPQGQFDFIQGYSGYDLMSDFMDFIYEK